MDTFLFFSVIKQIFTNPLLSNKRITFDLNRLAYKISPWPNFILPWPYIWKSLIKSTGDKSNVKSLKVAAGKFKRGDMSREALTELKQILSSKIKQGAIISSDKFAGSPNFYFIGIGYCGGNIYRRYSGGIIYHRNCDSFAVHT